METFIKKHADYFNSVSRETYMAISHTADIKEMEKYIENKKETEVIDMCEALRQIQEENRQIGKQQGVQIGKQQGVQIGKQQGIQIGRQEGRRQVAANLLKMNHPVPFVAQATELSEDEVREIKNKM